MNCKLATSFWFAVVSCLCFMLPVYADVRGPEFHAGPHVLHLQKRITPGVGMVGSELIGEDFRGLNLKGTSFTGLCLNKANFDNCNLDGVSFEQCGFRDASFKRTSFKGCHIDDCDFQGSDFGDANLSGLLSPHNRLVYTRNRNIYNRSYGTPAFRILEATNNDKSFTVEQFVETANFKNKNFSCGASYPIDLLFRHTGKRDFSKAKFIYSSVHCTADECSIADADISGALITTRYLSFKHLASTSNYRRGELQSMDITVNEEKSFKPWNLRGIDLSGSCIRGNHIEGYLDLTDATIDRCSFYCGDSRFLRTTRNFKIGEMLDMKFKSLDFTDFDFTGQNLSGSSFFACNFKNANFKNAIISATLFYGRKEGEPSRIECKNLTFEQIKSTWNYKHNRMEGIGLPDDIVAALEEESKVKESKEERGD